MRLAILSDFHGASELLPSLKEFLPGAADAVFFCGDAVKGHARGDEWLSSVSERRQPVLDKPEIQAEKSEDIYLYGLLYNMLRQSGMPVFAVPGNMDAPERRFAHYVLPMVVSSSALNVVHLSRAVMKPYLIAGIGGELVETAPHRELVLQYSRKEAEFAIGLLAGASVSKILVTHTPPVSALGLDEGSQKGSDIVNSLIELVEPAFVFCGHAHRAQGEDQIGSALVINPGALKYGSLALLDTGNLKVSFHNLA